MRFRLRQQRWYLWEPFAKSDRFMLGVFTRIVRPGDVVYDVGANIGIYVRILSQWFGASRVLAFEPMTRNIELLRQNVELGNLGERVEIFPLALGDTDGEEDLQIDDVRSSTAALDRVTGGEASAGRRHFDLAPATERVMVARLDTLHAGRDLPAPDVLKIDVEGAEALVVAGARETLSKHRPRLAVATHGPDRAAETIAALETLGYFCYGFVARGGQRAYARVHAADGGLLANNNFIASTIEDDVRDPIEPCTAAQCRRRDDRER